MKRILTIVSLIVLLIHTPAFAAKPKVFVINSYHASYPWVQSHNEALQNELGDTATLSFHYMDTKRISPDQHDQRATLAMEEYWSTKPDLVVLTDDNALRLLGSRISNAGTPVVYLGINENPRQYISHSTKATGVLERPLLKRSIVFIKELLHGRLNKCLVMFDNGSTSCAIVKNTFGGKDSMNFADTTVDLQLVATFFQWKTHVLASKQMKYDAIILGLFHTLVDEEGNHVPDAMVSQWTSENSPVPVFGFWDFAIGKRKAIGGLVLAGEPQGREAAKLIKRVLAGEDPMTVEPVTAEHGRFVFSRSQMKRWGITIPANFVHPGEELIYVD